MRIDEMIQFPELQKHEELPERMAAALQINVRSTRHVIADAVAEALRYGDQINGASTRMFWRLAEGLITAVNGGYRAAEDRSVVMVEAATRGLSIDESHLIITSLGMGKARLERGVEARYVPEALIRVLVEQLVPRVHRLLMRWGDQGVFADPGPARRKRT